jgi:hypothetical protein
MGYACPVCEDPQADAGHLANHLAFTAILGDDAHEQWLDERVPEWGEMSEAELGEVVVEHVEETEFPQVFEDTVGGLEESVPDAPEERSGALFEDEGFGPAGHDHERRHGSARAGPAGEMDPETEAIIEEAREMTREMLREEDAESAAGRAGGRADDSADGRADDAEERAGGRADENA